MRFARWVFLIAGVYGLLVTLPMYFLEARIGRDQPPAVTHPEFYYGFVGLCLAWQICFLIISRDPVRFRPIMLAAVIEKAAFAIAVPVLYSLGRVAVSGVVMAGIDAVLGVLFAAAWWKLRPVEG